MMKKFTTDKIAQLKRSNVSNIPGEQKVNEEAQRLEEVRTALKGVKKKGSTVRKSNLENIEIERSLADSMKHFGSYLQYIKDDEDSALLGECLMKFNEFHSNNGSIRSALDTSLEQNLLLPVDAFLKDLDAVRVEKREHDKIAGQYSSSLNKVAKNKSDPEARREEQINKELWQKSEEEKLEHFKAIMEKNQQELMNKITKNLLVNLERHLEESLKEVATLRAALSEARGKADDKGGEKKKKKKKGSKRGKESASSSNAVPIKKSGKRKTKRSGDGSSGGSEGTDSDISPPSSDRQEIEVEVSPAAGPSSPAAVAGSTRSGQLTSSPSAGAPATSPLMLSKRGKGASASPKKPRDRVEEYVWDNGDKYVGQWKGDQRHGQGTFYYTSGHKYEGQWQMGNRHGKGAYTFANGDKYEGDYKDNKKEGFGVFTFADNGDRYEGEWVDDKQHGRGTFYFASGNKFEGFYENDEKHGPGVYTWEDGTRFEGMWRNDKKHGKGQLVHPDGGITLQWYDDGVLVREKELDDEDEEGN